MKCPHCEKELSDSLCPECGEGVLKDANYCMMCGAALAEGLAHVAEQDGFLDDGEEIDLDSRILCPDGSCTGIIINGKCTECGRTPEEVASQDEELAAPAEEKSDDIPKNYDERA